MKIIMEYEYNILCWMHKYTIIYIVPIKHDSFIWIPKKITIDNFHKPYIGQQIQIKHILILFRIFEYIQITVFQICIRIFNNNNIFKIL